MPERTNVSTIQRVNVPANLLTQTNESAELTNVSIIQQVDVPDNLLTRTDESAMEPLAVRPAIVPVIPPPALPGNSTSVAPSSRRHSRGQRNKKRTAEPQECRKIKQRRRRNKHYRMRRTRRRKGHQPSPLSPSDPSEAVIEKEACMETDTQSTGAYVSRDGQGCAQLAQSDEQLAWRLHREMLLESQPRRSAALRSQQALQDLACSESGSEDECIPESDPESDMEEEVAPIQAPLVLAALRASNEETIKVGAEPIVVRIPASRGSHAATLVFFFCGRRPRPWCPSVTGSDEGRMGARTDSEWAAQQVCVTKLPPFQRDVGSLHDQRMLW